MNQQQRLGLVVATLHVLAGATGALVWTDLVPGHNLQRDLAIQPIQMKQLALALRKITSGPRPKRNDISGDAVTVLDVCSKVLAYAGDQSEQAMSAADVAGLIALAKRP